MGPGSRFITEFVVRGAFGQGQGTPKSQPRMSATGVGKPAQAGHCVVCSLLESGRIDARDGWAYLFACRRNCGLIRHLTRALGEQPPCNWIRNFREFDARVAQYS